MLDLSCIILGLIHLGIPLLYYVWLKGSANKPWNVKIDPNYMPDITILVPTYQEAALIDKRLDNIYEQDYPKSKMKIFVVDSASEDGTVALARNWASRHGDVEIDVVQESLRRGKPHALNNILPMVDTDILVVTDADCFWREDAVGKAVAYLSDPHVGIVTGIKRPQATSEKKHMIEVEKSYRNLYNIIRICESKVHSTPIIAGELYGVKKKPLLAVGGFDLVNDDSYTAMKIVLQGYRAITVDEIEVFELSPGTRKSYIRWKLVRAQHLQHNFINLLKRVGKYPKELKKIISVEAYLHLINPWMLFAAPALLTTPLLKPSAASLMIILAASAALIIPKTRKLAKTWLMEQLILIAASVRNTRTKDVAWNKVEEIRA